MNYLTRQKAVRRLWNEMLEQGILMWFSISR